jgi:hypothetical protein
MAVQLRRARPVPVTRLRTDGRPARWMRPCHACAGAGGARVPRRARATSRSARASAGRRRRRPGQRRAPFPSFVWAALTEIHLCHACSCPEIFRLATARQGGGAHYRAGWGWGCCRRGEVTTPAEARVCGVSGEPGQAADDALMMRCARHVPATAPAQSESRLARQARRLRNRTTASAWPPTAGAGGAAGSSCVASYERWWR